MPSSLRARQREKTIAILGRAITEWGLGSNTEKNRGTNTQNIYWKRNKKYKSHQILFCVFSGQILFSTTVLHEFCVKIVKIMYNRQGRFNELAKQENIGSVKLKIDPV